MLGVVQHAHIHSVLGERIAERGHRPVAATRERDLGARVEDDDVDGRIPIDVRLLSDRLQGEAAPGCSRIGQVLRGEDRPHRLGGDLAARLVGHPLDDLGELDLESAREFEFVLGAHDVGDTALARLRVDADDGLVGASDVLGIDGQVGDLPAEVVDGYAGCRRVDLHVRQALVDGVLVRPGERRIDQVAAVRVTLVHGDLVAVLHRATEVVDIAHVELRVDALAEEVHAQGDEADVAGALAIAEEAALDAVGAGHVAELGGGDSRAAVVVRVQ